MKNDIMRKAAAVLAGALLVLLLAGCGGEPINDTPQYYDDLPAYAETTGGSAQLDGAHTDRAETPGPAFTGDIAEDPAGGSLPEWDGKSAWTELNNGEPWFSDGDKSRTDAFEDYAELDRLGRCGQAYANICTDIMPTEPRGDIGSVRPSGWHTVKYNDLVEGNYLYNRCHLIGFQLAGENANERNLITGTRYLNIDGMLWLEDAIADYVKDTGNHVLYRVTPVFYGEELVCRGLVLEAWSVEDRGDGIRACVYAWNAQPGIEIDYMTGHSVRSDGRDQIEIENEAAHGEARDYVVNMSTGKIHRPDCWHAEGISPENRLEVHEGLGKLHEAGYTDCGSCKPDKD